MNTYSINSLHKELGMNRETVTNVIKRVGCPVTETDSRGDRYTLENFLLSYEAYKETKPKRRDVPDDFNSLLVEEMRHKVRKLAAEADMIEMRYADEQMEIVKVGDVLVFLQKVVVNIVTQLDRIFDNKLPIEAEGKNKAQLRGIYERHKNEVRDAVIEALNEYVSSLNQQPVNTKGEEWNI